MEWTPLSLRPSAPWPIRTPFRVRRAPRACRTLGVVALLLFLFPFFSAPSPHAQVAGERTPQRHAQVSAERCTTCNLQPPTPNPSWLHTTQADWMAGEREGLDVRTLDALGTPYGLDQDERGAMRLHSRPGPWTPHPQNPVIEPDLGEAWDNAVISEAKVVYDGQRYRMWYAGRRRGPPGLKMPMDVGYATSPDGVHWTKAEANPVLVRGPLGSYDENMITAPFCLYDGEQFRMWFGAVDFRGDWSIDYATSPDGLHWTKAGENPLLQETHDARWDAVYVTEPCVVFDGDLFHLWYNGASATTETLLGHATSPDGLHWTREDRPALDVQADGAWDDFAVARAAVLYDGEEFKLWYEGHDGSTWRIGYATSPDGVTWERFPGNPIVDLGPEGAWDARVVSEPYVLFDGQTYRLWHSGYDGETYRVGLATAPAVYDERGTFVSPPFESADPIRWGTLSYDVSLPQGTGVRLEVATSQDGETWTAWTVAAAECLSGANEISLEGLGLAPSRYLRYRAGLSTAERGVSPLLRAVGAAEAAPDFRIRPAAERLTLPVGGRVEMAVEIEGLYGFGAPVELGIEGLPGGLAATWTPDVVAQPGMAALVLPAALGLGVPSAAIPLTLTARSEGVTRAAPLALDLVAPPPTPTPTRTPPPTPTATPTATPLPTATPTPSPTPTPLPTPAPLPPPQPGVFWLGWSLAGGGVLLFAAWLALRLFVRPADAAADARPWWQHWAWTIACVLLVLAGLYLLWRYVGARRQEWAAYQAGIRPGVQVGGAAVDPTLVPSVTPLAPGETATAGGQLYVAGIDATGMTEDELRQAVEARFIAPYRRTIAVRYGTCRGAPDGELSAALDTDELDLQTNLDEIVAQAVAVGGGQEGFGSFLLHNPEPYDVSLPLTYTLDARRLEGWVEARAAEIEQPAVEHALDVETLTWTRGQTGVQMDREQALRRLRAAVLDLSVTEVELPVTCTPPGEPSDDELRLTLSRAAAAWNEPPEPASSVQITIPFDAGRWVGPGTPAADWQPTRTMTGYAFLPGRMGWALDVPAAQRALREALDAGVPQASVRVLTDVAPAPLTLTDVHPLLLDIAGHFDGFTGFYVRDLQSGAEIRHHASVTTSGMSMIKVAIMVTAYRTIPRPFSAPLEEAMGQMIAHSINEKSNYVLLQIGEGDFQRGLARVNETLQALELRQTYIRTPYRTAEGPFIDPIPVPERPPPEIPAEDQIDLWPDTAMQTSLADMARLFGALYYGAQGGGPLLEAFPSLSAADCQEMLDLLKTNPTRTFLAPGFSDDVPMAHKNGFGGGQYTDERMNVGIIWPPGGRPYLVGLYQWDRQDWIHWLRVWPQQIEFSTTLYNYFTMGAPEAGAPEPGAPVPP